MMDYWTEPDDGDEWADETTALVRRDHALGLAELPEVIAVFYDKELAERVAKFLKENPQ